MASNRKRWGEGQCKHRRGKSVSVGLYEIMCVKLLKVGRPTIELDFRGGSDSKESACNTGDPGSVPGSGRSPGEGNGNPLQYSDLENPMDGGSWQATVHGVTKSWTRLSDFTFIEFEEMFIQ